MPTTSASPTEALARATGKPNRGSFLSVQPLAGGPLESYSFGAAPTGPMAQDADYVCTGGNGSVIRMHKATHVVDPVATNGGMQTFWEMDVLGGFVYWSQLPISAPSNTCAGPGSIRRANVTTGAPELLGSVSEPFYMSVGGDAVYTMGCTMVNGTDYNVIYKVNLDGTPPEMIGDHSWSPDRVVADDDAIYFVDGFDVLKLAK